MHVLAGAIDAALGIDEAVERAGRLASLDAAVGQVEGARREIEEGVFAAGAFGDEQRRLQAAFAARQAGVELGVAVRVGLGGAEHLVVAGDQLTLTPTDGLASASERTNACTPSSPEKAVRPRSETMNHCVASVL